MRQLFRLELAENGGSIAMDFTEYENAMEAFKTSKRRKSVLSVRLLYNDGAYEKHIVIAKFVRLALTPGNAA